MANTQAMAGSAEAAAKQLVAALLSADARGWWEKLRTIAQSSPAKAILQAEKAVQVAVLHECVNQIAAMRDLLGPPGESDVRYMNLHHQEAFPHAVLPVISQLLRRKLPLTESDLTFLIERTAYLERVTTWCCPYVPAFVEIVAKRSEETGQLSIELLEALQRLFVALSWIDNAPERKLRHRIERIASGRQKLPVEPGEAWSDAAISRIGALPVAQQRAWVAVLAHCATAKASAPSKAWLAAAKSVLGELPKDSFKSCVLEWFPLVNRPRTRVVERYPNWQPDPNQMLIEPHLDLLKGMAWMCGLHADEEMARALAGLARSAYRKVPKIGPRAVKVGNACVPALSMMRSMAAVGQLSVLRAAVKIGTAQKMIEKAFTSAAEALGLPREEIEELGVPTYGLEDVGVRRDEFGEYAAELRVNGREVSLSWKAPGGKTIKSVPAKVKTDHKDELKELQGAVKDILAMLPAQVERIDSMYLRQKRWPIETWRERYLNHPLVGTIARRLIWCVETDGASRAAMYRNGQLVNVDDEPVQTPAGALISLWHPIGRDLDDVMSWRTFLQRHEIRQPFKQAYREVYVLTEAERRTNTYSNRFAAHVVRQHQFNALCALRGWKNKLRLLVDDTYPPAARILPQWGLRAEFWVEGLGDNYGTDTNESGVFLRLSTDQVRFYRLEAAENSAQAGSGAYVNHAAGPGEANVNEPLPLEQIPPLVLSEILRDVDLFVGVASVGNDPTWHDGGPEGRYRTYWQDYSFGELSETAKTRHAVLQTLIPRLSKIRDQCSLSDRFLVVKGHLRTYKIHLGSGNILMEPNDQYLCIVPGQSSGKTDVFLPFEGDATLAIIISKALLLADDTNIKDVTITRQLQRP